MSTLDRATKLAEKLDALNQHFDIVDSTINECTEYVKSIEETSTLTITTNEPDSNLITSQDMLTLLKQDFMSTREVLTDNLVSGRSVLNTVNAKLTMFEDDLNPELVSAFANLMKTINDSTKLLIGLYGDIVKIYKGLSEIAKNEEDKESDITIEGDVTINTISGNISDIIKQIRTKDVG
jgi:hypothetical protein